MNFIIFKAPVILMYFWLTHLQKDYNNMTIAAMSNQIYHLMSNSKVNTAGTKGLCTSYHVVVRTSTHTHTKKSPKMTKKWA